MSRSSTKSSCYQDALDLARWFQAQVRPRSRKRSSLVMAGFPRVSRFFVGPFYRGWSAWNIFAMVDRGCWLVLICVVGMFNMFQSCSIIFGIVRENETWMTSIFAQGGWSHKPSSFGSRFQGCMGPWIQNDQICRLEQQKVLVWKCVDHWGPQSWS